MKLFRFIAVSCAVLCISVGQVIAADKIKLRLSTSTSEADLRAVGLATIFADGVAEFAEYEPYYGDKLFKQGTELVAISRGHLEMSITSAQELATLIPEWSIFTTGYLMRDAEHQKKVFSSDIGKEMFQLAEDRLGVKLLGVSYFGKRHLNLRVDEKINTPEDMAGIVLRMPNTDTWQFLGKALGAKPVAMRFTEVYTGLRSGSIDGQDNPLPTTKAAKFHTVTEQIVLTGHLADMNFLAFSKKVWDDLSAEQQATVMSSAEAALDSITASILENEAGLVDFFKAEGLEVYEPDIDAFREKVQKAFLESDYAKDWPEGLLERINSHL